MPTQKELLQAVWRKAGRQAEPIRLKTKSKSEATKLRFDLYNAVREFRNGQKPADDALAHAIAECSLAFDKDDPSVLIVRKKIDKELTAMLEGLVDLGQDIVAEEETLGLGLADSLSKRLAEADDAPQVAIPGMRAVDRYFKKGD